MQLQTILLIFVALSCSIFNSTKSLANGSRAKSIPSLTERTVHMAKIPGGQFTSGCAEFGSKNGRLTRRVYLDSFWMDRYEVTNKEYEAFEPRHKRSRWSKGDKHSVTRVSWFKAKEYCLNLKKDLPSEAQWEMAAGAEDECSYPWGQESFNNVDGQRQAHAGLSLNEGASEIGQYSPNKYGLYDMAGNVWEWVNDWMDFGWKKNESVHKIIINPTGPISGHKKVRRGGSWSDDIKALSSGWRDWTAPDARYFSDIGFRCVYNP